MFIITKIAPLLTLFGHFSAKSATLKCLKQRFNAVGENLVVVVVVLLTRGSFLLFQSLAHALREVTENVKLCIQRSQFIGRDETALFEHL